MTTSMTAFARTERDHPFGRLTWEIRSVNHRYLDVHLKLPEELRFLESATRERIGGKLQRGRIDALLRFDPQATGGDARIDEEALASLAAAADNLSRALPDLRPASIGELLRWPGLFSDSPPDSEQVAAAALEGLDPALGALLEHRQREGGRMAEAIEQRLQQCRDRVAALKADWPAIETALKERWTQRAREIVDDIDPGRIHQELALLVTKADVSEELDRLETHFDEVAKVLAGNEPAGRRLDFLMQELNREANTLGSKSADTRTTAASLDLKVLIDQMREQVQNIE